MSEKKEKEQTSIFVALFLKVASKLMSRAIIFFICLCFIEVLWLYLYVEVTQSISSMFINRLKINLIDHIFVQLISHKLIHIDVIVISLIVSQAAYN